MTVEYCLVKAIIQPTQNHLSDIDFDATEKCDY